MDCYTGADRVNEWLYWDNEARSNVVLGHLSPFPSIRAGAGSPSTVADAMVGGITDFVKKKQPKYISSVKIEREGINPLIELMVPVCR